MAKSAKKNKKIKCDKNLNKMCNGCCGGVYFVGFIGAAIYYIATATSFWGGVLGVLKALVWPAFLVFEVFKFLGV